MRAKNYPNYFLLVSLAVITLMLALPACKTAPPPPAKVVTLPPVEIEPQEEAKGLPFAANPRLSRLNTIIPSQLAAGGVPGAVVLVGHDGKIIYRQAFGQRMVSPQVLPMSTDTIFDIASLTKVVATTIAVMQLVEAGKIDLDKPVATYWSAFGANGKNRVTVRNLLTHSSGLRADINPKYPWSGYDGGMAAIAEDEPVYCPGNGYLYSDANFVALGEVVRRVSGRTLDVYCAEKIFGPLGMRNTSYLPNPSLKGRIAPSDVRWGSVHDPTAHRLGGVAGNAGVFATADDLAILCQMILNQGTFQGKKILSPRAVALMIKPQHLPGSSVTRALGWDIRSPYSRAFNMAFPFGSFGHTGYTGTSIWMDPKSRTFLIILTNRLHPSGRGEVKGLRTYVSEAVGDAVPMGPPAMAANAPYFPDSEMLGFGASDPPDRVKPGIDVLASQGFASLAGKNIGVITNHTGRSASGRSIVEVLGHAPGVKIRAIFSPEHGLSGKLDEKVSSGRDPATGLPVYSLYGEVKRPTPEMLRGLDALVYDIQDVGVRFYTYITTLAYCMEAAASHGLDFYVLDRPNPITASAVQGPVLEPGLKSYVGYFALPVRYGMTVGELAQLFNQENRIGARLQVVKMTGYKRDLWFDQTGLTWVPPSPNLRTMRRSFTRASPWWSRPISVSAGARPLPLRLSALPGSPGRGWLNTSPAGRFPASPLIR
jgi:CubicO group peptidase (beta-lactamase class C family)